MKCPHCLVEFHSNPRFIQILHDVDGTWGVSYELCPQKKCKRLIVFLLEGDWVAPGNVINVRKRILVRPKGHSRSPLSKEVPNKFANDYREACLVLADSPKASAALSRRCLQNILREVAKVTPANLDNEIQQVIDGGKLPSYLVESIDAIRNIGNFAAHPIKSQKTGEVIDVESGEAEWNLDVLEALFDFYFVQPAKIRAKKTALNTKLTDAGKKPMKRGIQIQGT